MRIINPLTLINATVLGVGFAVDILTDGHIATVSEKDPKHKHTYYLTIRLGWVLGQWVWTHKFKGPF